MELTDFMSLVTLLGDWAAEGFAQLDAAVIIDSPRVSLFGMMIGFTLLELLLFTINRLRPGDPYAMAGSGQDKTDINKYGGVSREYSPNRGDQTTYHYNEGWGR